RGARPRRKAPCLPPPAPVLTSASYRPRLSPPRPRARRIGYRRFGRRGQDSIGEAMTQQGIPEFKWSDNALKVRQYLYEYWCDKGWGPSLRNVHEDLGLSREA